MIFVIVMPLLCVKIFPIKIVKSQNMQKIENKSDNLLGVNSVGLHKRLKPKLQLEISEHQVEIIS